MSDEFDKPPTTSQAEEQLPAAPTAERMQSENGGEVQEEPVLVSKEETEADPPDMTGQSDVYTAKKDTLFPAKKGQAERYALALDRVYGIKPLHPVITLQDHDHLVIFYATAYVGIIYNHTLNSQHILKGHSQSISCLCVSEDRRWIGTADQGPKSMVFIWDSYSGIPVQTLFDCHPKGNVTAMGFSGDTKYLVTVGNEEVQNVCVWDWTKEQPKPLSTAELHPTYGFQDYITFNINNSNQMLSSSGTHVVFYRRANENLQHFTLNMKKLNKVLTKKRDVAETLELSDAVTLADMSLSRAMFYRNEPQVVAAIGNVLVMWSVGEGVVANQSRINERVKTILQQPTLITVLTMSDSYIVTGDNQGEVRFFCDKFKLTAWFHKLNLDAIVSISFSKECNEGFLEDNGLEDTPVMSRNFVVCTVNSSVMHVNPQRSNFHILLQEDYEPIHTVGCHPKQSILATGNRKGVLKLWDYNLNITIGCVDFGTEMQIHCLTFQPEGIYLAIGFSSGDVRILKLQTLQSEPEEGFQYSKESIHLMTFSSDSKYLATADAGNAVTVFQWQTEEGSPPCWAYLGRYCSHYKPIKDLLFGVHLDSTQPRLLSLGMDRRLVDYDLENSVVDDLRILSSEHIEQSAVPLCMTWYPPLTKEEFLLTASDKFKLKLYNSTTKMCRKVLLGPVYGSSIKKIMVLPKCADHETSEYNLAFITDDKVGLQMLPLDGNPYKSNALTCHPTGVSGFACSHDGQHIFTSGKSDCAVLSWKINLEVLKSAAALGGEDMEPFYSLLDGGRNGRFYREMEYFFYYCQVRLHGVGFMEKRQVSTRIPFSEVPFLMRALGYYPTEQEIEDMQNEVMYSKYVETNEYVTDIDLEEFIKLYVNHRPAFGISFKEIAQAFRVLCTNISGGRPVLQSYELLELIQARGEHMTEEEVAECFAKLLGLSDEDSDSGGSDSEDSIECAIPDEITVETFISDILHFP